MPVFLSIPKDIRRLGGEVMELGIPSLQSGGAGARPSARRRFRGMNKAGRLTSWTGTRSESGVPGWESQACRPSLATGPG